MTSTERILAAMSFEKPDRVPTWDNFWDGFSDIWRRDMGLGPDVEPEDYYGIDLVRCQANELFFPSEVGVVSDDGTYRISRDGWGRVVRSRKGETYFSQTVSSVLDDPSALDALEFEPASMESRYTKLEQDAAKERAAGRCVLTKIGGIYVRSHFMRGEENLLVDMAADEGFCDALFDKVAEHLAAVALESLRRIDGWEVGLCVYDDMANLRSTMFSPAMFERYFLPRYAKLIRTVRQAGCKRCLLHSDGNIRPVMDMLLEAGFDGFHPLEPRCGLDLVELRKRYGDRAVLTGGVCNTMVLPRGDRAEIEAHVAPLIELAREGGVILGSASTGRDISPEAYDFYQSLVRPRKRA